MITSLRVASQVLNSAMHLRQTNRNYGPNNSQTDLAPQAKTASLSDHAMISRCRASLRACQSLVETENVRIKSEKALRHGCENQE